jgi:transcriptional regulator with GAF, ATPase, and Fis domain
LSAEVADGTFRQELFYRLNVFPLEMPPLCEFESSINAMVWMRGMQRDYDGWAKNGAKGWA